MDKSTHIGDTIRIRRPPRVTTDALGHTVWMSEVDPVSLELEADEPGSCDPYDTAAGPVWTHKVRGILADS